MYETYNFSIFLFRATLIPAVLLILWLTGLISYAAVQIGLILFLTLFVGFPIAFRYSISLQRGLLFLTFVSEPKNFDYTYPAGVGLYATRNFYLSSRDPDIDDEEIGVRIGVWHVLPRHLAKRFAGELKINENDYPDLQNITTTDEWSNSINNNNQILKRMLPIIKSEFTEVTPQNENLFFERMLKLPGTIVLYLHGNTKSRCSSHRVQMYQMLRNLGYHVIALDYRGYGDSDPVSPSEEGVVRDAMTVYQYITNLTTNPVIIWGHSLGTGVSTHLSAQLNYMKVPSPRGVILESPFTSVRDEIRKHPFARIFKDLPWFDLTIVMPMYSNSLRFENDQHISEFRQPVMILHAEDDHVVPFQLGYKLYRIALDTRGKSWGPVEFHRFDSTHHYGHKFLVRAPELPELVKNFINNYSNTVY